MPTITSALDWTAIPAAIYNWVLKGSGFSSSQIYWEQQSSQRPPEPCISMLIRRVEDAGLPWVDASRNVLTFAPLTVSSVSTGASTLTITAHGLVTGDGPVQFTGSLPAPLKLLTNYWVIVINTNTIQLASTYTNTGGNFGGNTITPMTLTTTGSGTIILSDTASTVRAGQEALMAARSPKRMRVQLTCYASTGIGLSMATAVLQRIATRAALPSQLSILDNANVGFNYCEHVRAVRGTKDAVLFEPRAVMEVVMNLPDQESETGGIIEQYVLTNTISDTVTTEQIGLSTVNVIPIPFPNGDARITYIATGVEGTDFFVPITRGPATTASYSVLFTSAGMASTVIVECPDTLDTDRTVNHFRVVTSGTLTAGDRLEFVLVF